MFINLWKFLTYGGLVVISVIMFIVGAILQAMAN